MESILPQFEDDVFKEPFFLGELEKTSAKLSVGSSKDSTNGFCMQSV